MMAALAGSIPAIVHEDWTHNNIVPKTLWLKYILDFVAYLVLILPFQRVVSPRLLWTHAHLYHHIVWKTTDDPTQRYIDDNHLAIMLFTTKFSKPLPLFANDKEFVAETKKYKRKLDKVSLFLDDHFTVLVTLVHLLVLSILGIELYFYLMLLPTWGSVRFMIWFGDILPHRNKKTKQDEHDIGLCWLGSSAAYHISHHYHPNDITLGKGWRKYFDIMFYVIKIFYNLGPKTKFRN